MMSDYSDSAVAMLDANGNVIDPRWIDSGTTTPSLISTLSGDAVLPSQFPPDGAFVIVDRFRTDVVSRFEIPSGALLGQVHTQDPPGPSGTAYSANPQDYLQISANEAWLSRFEHNADPMPLPTNRGTDLVEIDPATMTRTGRTIDLSGFDSTGIAESDMGPVTVPVYARPSRLVRVGGHMLVGLTLLSDAFDAASEGRLAIVDLDDDTVESYVLTGLANCGRVAPIPGETQRVLVGCGGFSATFGDDGPTRESSGVLVLRIESDGSVVEEASWRPADHPTAALSVQDAVALDARTFVAVAYGSFDPFAPDALYRVDLTTGEQTVVLEGVGAYELGEAAYDRAAERLLVPDASAGLHRLRKAPGGTMVAEGAIDFLSIVGLPPRRAYVLSTRSP
jgi:hypothetical protein